jgi:hypothetical protein
MSGPLGSNVQYGSATTTPSQGFLPFAAIRQQTLLSPGMQPAGQDGPRRLVLGKIVYVQSRSTRAGRRQRSRFGVHRRFVTLSSICEA